MLNRLRGAGKLSLDVHSHTLDLLGDSGLRYNIGVGCGLRRRSYQGNAASGIDDCCDPAVLPAINGGYRRSNNFFATTNGHFRWTVFLAATYRH